MGLVKPSDANDMELTFSINRSKAFRKRKNETLEKIRVCGAFKKN